MYTIPQLQALDYLQKRITNDSSAPIYQMRLNLVVEITGVPWYGDFVIVENNSVIQWVIDDQGDIERVKFQPTGSNAVILLKQIWDTFTEVSTPKSHFHSNPFKKEKIRHLPLLFDSVLKLLHQSGISRDTPTPFHQYLLNAKSLDGRFSLPFVNLTNDMIKLVSIIEVPK